MFSELEHDKEQLERMKSKVETNSWKVKITENHLNLIPKIQECFLLIRHFLRIILFETKSRAVRDL